ncbi:MAG: dihydroorotase [Candidatus Eisenbacteria bacterium]|nr:dihydroorotase [Candidatus Eisenbacteria bacterium]
MKKTLLRGGRLVDPATRADDRLDLLIVDGKVAERAPNLPADESTTVLDVAGLVVCPGFVDMHVHLREPGREDEETIESGGLAAVHGGVTAMAAMPNTSPAMDTASWVEFVRTRPCAAAVHPIAAVTVGREGKVLTEMAELAAAGAVAFSDDGSPVASGHVMRMALQYASMVGRPIIAHCEDADLARGGAMHEGLASTIAGLKPSPAAAEEVMVARDVILARATGARLHIAHVSTGGSVELVRRAKADGAAVTCETCPHYLSLTDDDVRTYDTSFKVNPPLRSARDVEALREGLADGTIDAVASDHAPHSLEEKQVEFDAAPPGAIGLETTLPVVVTHLVAPGIISLSRAVEVLSVNPAAILGVPGGTLEVGAPADVAVFDAERRWKVDEPWFRSRSRNSPFIGHVLCGRVTMTLRGGEVVFSEPEHDDPGDCEARESDARARGGLPVRV